jgi:hypothetical protein
MTYDLLRFVFYSRQKCVVELEPKRPEARYSRKLWVAAVLSCDGNGQESNDDFCEAGRLLSQWRWAREKKATTISNPFPLFKKVGLILGFLISRVPKLCSFVSDKTAARFWPTLSVARHSIKMMMKSALRFGTTAARRSVPRCPLSSSASAVISSSQSNYSARLRSGALVAVSATTLFISTRNVGRSSSSSRSFCAASEGGGEEGYTTTASGLQYKDITVGTGEVCHCYLSRLVSFSRI